MIIFTFVNLLSLPAGWLVDVTGSYTATFFLSGTAMLASALTLTIVAGIRCCRLTRVPKDVKQDPLPPILSNQMDGSVAIKKEVQC